MRKFENLGRLRREIGLGMCIMNNLTTEIEQASVFSLQNFAKIDKHVDVSTTQN